MVGFSFEMCGRINVHTIEYVTPLTLCCYLLAKRLERSWYRKGSLHRPILMLETVPVAEKYGTVENDYIWHYEESQRELEARLVETDEGFKGHVGEVWFLADKTFHVIASIQV